MVDIMKHVEVVPSCSAGGFSSFLQDDATDTRSAKAKRFVKIYVSDIINVVYA